MNRYGLAWMLALVLSSACERERPLGDGFGHEQPRVERELGALALTGGSPWVLDPSEVGALTLPAGLTPCDAEANDWLHDDLSLVVARCDGAIFGCVSDSV